jgi:hypothetical protein
MVSFSAQMTKEARYSKVIATLSTSVLGLRIIRSVLGMLIFYLPQLLFEGIILFFKFLDLLIEITFSAALGVILLCA